MDNKYYVEFTTHNAKTGATNYKQTKEYSTYDEAFQAWCGVFSTYINYGDLDHVCAIIFDSYANPYDHRYWHKGNEPEPNEE